MWGKITHGKGLMIVNKKMGKTGQQQQAERLANWNDAVSSNANCV